ncbi:elongation factor P [Mariprofundus micogutta]|uniref:Elongation factor P n=1 Tax=Mariprofundus micogutta TaxID=1921010 RepID=A0A1L8CPE9_9PROT|nr:elongation factor P [Mariprofundus micogutta]GAV20806.1 elongation factor P [Mariprofundus micogutta]
MQIAVTAIRVGNILEYNNALWRVMKTQHVTPGKGVACMQVEMRNIETGNKTNKRFNSTERIERVILSQREMQYLYADGDDHHFMDTETYDQITLSTDMLDNALPYLLPEAMVTVEFHEERPLNVQLPQAVTLEVVECDAAIKGQTATSSYKPGKLETGAAIMVPPYLEAGTKVRVNTESGEYMERA